ncbi:MAG: hypothetical protein P1P82_11365 [Bacteroidales bacterium]|nr:hypothetical protein [Bacteroidales bacterium]MDT8431172.1 hypothetical protein [Bacteroidales bacterium]
MAGWSRNIAICGLVCGMVFSCTPLKRLGGGNNVSPAKQGTLSDFCATDKSFKTLYISGIDAKIIIDNKEYDSRVSLYYLPDSLFLLSAVNSGFEIVRLGVAPDSTVYINRLDKLAYIIRSKDTGYAPPVLFRDLERLLNRQLLCEGSVVESVSDSLLLLDHSEQDISKKIFYRLPGPKVWKFEFFQKKTGEYVVGELDAEQKIIIYSNYIMDNITLKAEGGDVEYNKVLDVNLAVNRRKYTIVYL